MQTLVFKAMEVFCQRCHEGHRLCYYIIAPHIVVRIHFNIAHCGFTINALQSI